VVICRCQVADQRTVESFGDSHLRDKLDIVAKLACTELQRTNIESKTTTRKTSIFLDRWYMTYNQAIMMTLRYLSLR